MMWLRSKQLRGFLLAGLLIGLATASDGELCSESQDTPQSLSLLQTSLDLRLSEKGVSQETHSRKREEANGHARRQNKTAAPGEVDLDGSHSSILVQTIIGYKAAPIIPLLVLGCVAFLAFNWDGHQSELIVDETLTSKGELKPHTYGAYDRFFLKHRNYQFGSQSERAFRAACIFGLYALPFNIPKGYLPVTDYLIDLGVYSKFIGQQILFNYQDTIGATIRSAAELMIGTFIAVLTIFLMLGFYPDGVAKDIDGHVYKFGIMCGFFYFLGVIWLNFPMKLKIFCLLRFSEYLMDFLNPSANVAETYSVGFHFKLHGTAAKAFVGAFAGSVLALLACLLPCPHLAIVEAEKESFKTIGLLKECWTTFYDFMKQPLKRPDMMSKMTRELFAIKLSIDACENKIKTSWWECLGIGHRQRKRKLLTALNKSSMEMYLSLLGAFQCVTADDTFHEQHEAIMGRLDVIGSLIGCAGETMYFTCKCIAMPEPPLESLESSVQATRHAIGSVTKNFLETKRDLRLPAVCAELLEEHVFCRLLCVFGRKTSELAKSVGEACGGDLSLAERSVTNTYSRSGLTPNTMPTTYTGPDIFSVFDPRVIYSFDHMQLSGRLSVTFAVGFAVAYFGVGEVLAPYNKLIPTTMALLIAKGKGLQLTKNLMRLQGVVLGMAVGMLLHAFVGGCSLWSCTYATSSLMLWIWIAKLGHNSGKDYAYLCFLLALFGQNEMVVPCSKGFDPADADFKVVFGVVAAIAIMTLVDMLAPIKPASQEAAETVETTWKGIAGAVDAAFKPHSHRDDRKGELLKLINTSYALSEAAALEPRFWKTPWREQTFLKCLETLRLIRASLHSVEDCTEFSAGAHSDFGDLLGMDSLTGLLNHLQAKLESQQGLMKIFLHEETTYMPALDPPCAVLKSGEIEFAALMVECAAEASRKALKVDPSESLEYDGATRFSHIIACLDCMRFALNHFQSIAVLNG